MLSLLIESLLLLSIFFITFYLLYLNQRTSVLLIYLTLLLLVYSFLSGMPMPFKLIFWIPLISIILLVSLPLLRKECLSKQLLSRFRQSYASLFDKQNASSDHHSHGWEAELFSGDPEWRHFSNLFPAKLSTEEQAFIDGPVTALCGMLNDGNCDRDKPDLSPEVWRYIKSSKFFALNIPSDYGGLQFSVYARSCIAMKLASRSVTAAVSVMLPDLCGLGLLLIDYGTKQQCDLYLPQLAGGEEIACIASAGSHTSIEPGKRPHGVVSFQEYEGKQTLGIRVTWDELFIPSARLATLLGIAFDLHDPDHILGNKEKIGITLAIIPGTTSGVTLDNSHKKQNMSYLNCSTQGDEVFIPMNWVLGGQEKIGKAEQMLINCQTVSEAVLWPALTTSYAKYVARNITAYARLCNSFDLSSEEEGCMHEQLGCIAGNTYMMNAVRMASATTMDYSHKPSIASAIINNHLAERLQVIAENSEKIKPDSGLAIGLQNHILSLFKALPITTTLDSNNQLPCSVESFLQMAKQSNACFAKEILAMMEPNEKQSTTQFDLYYWQYAHQFAVNIGRSLIIGITNSRYVSIPVTTHIKQHYQQLSRLFANFALITNFVLIKFSNSLKNKQQLFAHMCDMLGWLYLSSATLEYYRFHGEREAEKPLLEWAMQQCQQEFHLVMQETLLDLHGTFGVYILRFMIYPFGAPQIARQDELHDQISASLMSDMEIRTLLADEIYQSSKLEEPQQLLESAFQWAIKAAPLEKLVRRAKRLGRINNLNLEEAVAAGVITDLEAEVIRNAKATRMKALELDKLVLY